MSSLEAAEGPGQLPGGGLGTAEAQVVRGPRETSRISGRATATLDEEEWCARRWMEDGWKMDGGWMEDGWRMDGGWMKDECRMDGGWMDDGWMEDGWRMDGG